MTHEATEATPSRWRRWRAGIVPAATCGLVALTLAPLAARLHPLVDLAAQFLVQAAVVTAVALALAVLCRRTAIGAVLAACLAAQAAQLYPHSAHGGAHAATGAATAGSTLKLIHFNLYDRNADYAATLDFLLREDADIVSLVEVTRYWQRALQPLARRYPYRVDCVTIRRCDVAVFSKIPWEGVKLGLDRGVDLTVFEARFTLADGPLTLFATHLTRPFNGPLGAQQAQARRLAGRMAGVEGRKLLLGDLNAVPWSAVLDEIRGRAGVVRLGGLEGTWPSFLAFPAQLTIDHALVDPSLKDGRVRVGPYLGSDHLPLILELRAAGPAR